MSRREVGQLKRWHPHLGSSLEVTTASNPHASEYCARPDTLLFFRCVKISTGLVITCPGVYAFFGSSQSIFLKEHKDKWVISLLIYILSFIRLVHQISKFRRVSLTDEQFAHKKYCWFHLWIKKLYGILCIIKGEYFTISWLVLMSPTTERFLWNSPLIWQMMKLRESPLKQDCKPFSWGHILFFVFLHVRKCYR